MWNKLSSGKKIGIIGGVSVLLIGILYVVVKSKKTTVVTTPAVPPMQSAPSVNIGNLGTVNKPGGFGIANQTGAGFHIG